MTLAVASEQVDESLNDTGLANLDSKRVLV
jgi:hypothetical protein